MNAKEIRKTFIDFFKSKGHSIVPGAPLVIKNDPTLMFTNAGMNQFKDIFLGEKSPSFRRVADTQKCLRVSGKHNDLEEVGIDTYHHTMFEMLGNWSFGDSKAENGIGVGYFKKEAIQWAWELLTKVCNLNPDRLYVTIFEGDTGENIEKDEEALACWKEWIDEDRILPFNKKDNFWEMGESGPCGPCSEIHFDIRPDEERKKVDGKSLVNKGDPQVIEIWNLVFIQFNRLMNGSLQPLPAKHVDTGMGFERLTRVLQNKFSNYDTDIFQPLIRFIEKISGIQYGNSEKSDIAMRVISDHIRAIAFAIADGQLPSNTGAGYVIRRILRRAVRYYYSFLNIQTPLLYKMIPQLAEEFSDVFPEIKMQQEFISKAVEEEEKTFLKTLEKGLHRLSNYFEIQSQKADAEPAEKNVSGSTSEKRPPTDLNHKLPYTIEGKFAFELYDTFGFPLDLTRLIASERNWDIDEEGFNDELKKQKERSRTASEIVSEDWIEINKTDKIEFVGYDSLQSITSVVKYRKQKSKEKEVFQLVLDKTPFYAESGGQVGDKGKLVFGDEEVEVLNTKKENDLIIHFVNRFPGSFNETVNAKVNPELRASIMNNHTATHLLHAALRKILGTHVQQKGSLVSAGYLRFDFSHFSKVNKQELQQIEELVNKKIRENILRQVDIMSVEEAMNTGAMALFGEKYGDQVRVITFDSGYSRELCGGTHVPATGAIGYFKIVLETAVAAGVRRIEAITGEAATQLISKTFDRLDYISELLGNAKDVEKSIQNLQSQSEVFKRQIESYNMLKIKQLKDSLKQTVEVINGYKFIGTVTDLDSVEALKKLSYDLRNEVSDLVFVGGAAIDGKANLCVIIADSLVKERSMDAVKIIRDISKEINGSGGGQKFFASAGGSDSSGLTRAIEAARNYLKN
ncbi:MAG: alanine--tRNA ligase [Chitinophagales bacterium]|nr:alanine--tRNA ligase [Chitinophagales bacterium]